MRSFSGERQSAQSSVSVLLAAERHQLDSGVGDFSRGRPRGLLMPPAASPARALSVHTSSNDTMSKVVIFAPLMGHGRAPFVEVQLVAVRRQKVAAEDGRHGRVPGSLCERLALV